MYVPDSTTMTRYDRIDRVHQVTHDVLNLRSLIYQDVRCSEATSSIVGIDGRYIDAYAIKT